MITRINKVMEAKKLSPTQFAAAINIQRSTLSHILSGRNNPSLDFIIKVVETFPDINLDWLARGVGDMHKTSNEKPDTTQSKLKAPAKEKVKEESPAVIAVEEKPVTPPKETKQHTSAPANTNTTPKNGIDSIIVLFSDGTYQIMK
ncbi:MAG: helix-turn-helix transcriptional regulator [Bacteroidales bacterium]|nr:helix-turn-helix transcriptional regulator [Bacteroidales bacterium]